MRFGLRGCEKEGCMKNLKCLLFERLENLVCFGNKCWVDRQCLKFNDHDEAERVAPSDSANGFLHVGRADEKFVQFRKRHLSLKGAARGNREAVVLCGP